ncbi:unnamed protein product, partial [Discosporangium mesarthrocarpum]
GGKCSEDGREAQQSQTTAFWGGEHQGNGDGGQGEGKQQGQGQGQGVDDKGGCGSEQWACSECTFLNPARGDICEMCLSNRPEEGQGQRKEGKKDRGRQKRHRADSSPGSDVGLGLGVGIGALDMVGSKDVGDGEGRPGSDTDHGLWMVDSDDSGGSSADRRGAQARTGSQRRRPPGPGGRRLLRQSSEGRRARWRKQCGLEEEEEEEEKEGEGVTRLIDKDDDNVGNIFGKESGGGVRVQVEVETSKTEEEEEEEEEEEDFYLPVGPDNRVRSKGAGKH